MKKIESAYLVDAVIKIGRKSTSPDSKTALAQISKETPMTEIQDSDDPLVIVLKHSFNGNAGSKEINKLSPLICNAITEGLFLNKALDEVLTILLQQNSLIEQNNALLLLQVTASILPDHLASISTIVLLFSIIVSMISHPIDIVSTTATGTSLQFLSILIQHGISESDPSYILLQDLILIATQREPVHLTLAVLAPETAAH